MAAPLSSPAAAAPVAALPIPQGTFGAPVHRITFPVNATAAAASVGAGASTSAAAGAAGAEPGAFLDSYVENDALRAREKRHREGNHSDHKQPRRFRERR